MPPTNLVIDAIGLVCAVGRSATAACAAIRAGVSRRRPLPGQTTLSADGEGEASTGHSVPIVTSGYALFARWRRLARAALLDLRSRLAADDDSVEAWRRTLAIVVAPPPAERSLFDEPRSETQWSTEHAEPLLRSAGIAIPSERMMVHVDSLSASALAAVPALLRDRGCNRVVLVVGDSCVEEGASRLLAEAGRLWMPDRPVGVSPGEAGVAVLLRANATEGLAIVGIATQHVDVADDADRALAGDRLAECVLHASRQANGNHSLRWITDLNGETWRASQLGHARVRLAATDLTARAFDTPASSTGDTGTAQFFVGIALAHHLHGRTGERDFLVTSSTYGGEVAACVLRTVPEQPRQSK